MQTNYFSFLTLFIGLALSSSESVHSLFGGHSFDQKSSNIVGRIQAHHQLNRTKENFGLTIEEFERLLRDLKHGDTTLFENVFLRHFQDCLIYLKNRFKAQHDDAYDSTMNTMLNFRNRLVAGKITYGNMRFLFTQMASQDYIRKMRSQKHDVIDDLTISDELHTAVDDDDLLLLEQAWKRLTPECQEILRMNYYQGMKLVDVAEALERSADSVRKQKERCKKKLIQFFNEQTN